MTRALVIGLMLLSPLASAGEDFFRPTRGNQYVSITSKNLFVVWSLPNNLAPVASMLADRPGLETFFARTAIYLCGVHSAERKVTDKPCLVQILRLKTNDEYSTSASGGFATVAKLVLPIAKSTPEALKQSLPLKRDELVKWFERFEVWHERLKL